ncbi:MAG TPA: Rne/Rng family ribonuclease [Dongiaceae bacterium]|nr:Rne/Rng family ribonuclease [Dongiaceae bacterium]
MSEPQKRNFSRRRRGGMRFRPGGGMKPNNSQPQRPDRAANEARAAAVSGETSGGAEKLFDRRHTTEIERAENVAAGLNPETAPETETPETPGTESKRSYREPNLETPAQVEEDDKPFEPVPVVAKPQGLLGAIKAAADTMVKKVQRFIRPKEKSNKDVIINAESLETRVAIMEEGKLEEFTIERTNEERLVGSIFKGKVRNLQDDLKAAFVDIGFEKNAFLHYWDIVPNQFDSGVEIVEREGGRKRDKPRITQRDIPRLYPPGSEIIVQVTKGPIGTKGPRVTTTIVLPGRYLVLLPNSDQSGISRKIENQEERKRLKQILREFKLPEGMGVIMRTAAADQKKGYFIRDLALLLDEWKLIQDRMKSQAMASCVFQEPDLIERTVRDFLTEDVDRIIVDNHQAYDRIRDMILKVKATSAAKKVKHYSESQPVFDRFGVTKQLESAFSRQVHLKSGGYIVVDETEALVAIDVNTGRHKGGRDQDSAILRVNLEAADEICRQLRLRNMGGLIVLDFIDMKSGRDRQQVYARMKQGLRRDKAKTHILPISQLGLMEMTRQRHSESVRSAVYDDCSYCKGRGKVKSTETMSVEIQRKLQEILKKRSRDESDFQLRIVVNPTVLERLRTEDEKLLIDLEKRYFGKLSFRADTAMHAEQFKIVNVITNEELVSVGS